MKRQFKLTGNVIDEPAIKRLMPQWESLLEDEMHSKGFTRDNNRAPVFISRKSEVGLEWELYMQGVFVGK